MKGVVKGIRLCKGAPKVNHLMFVDDSVLFCRVTLQMNMNILHLLDVYEKASRQKVNRNKTSMVFSKNVLISQQAEIM